MDVKTMQPDGNVSSGRSLDIMMYLEEETWQRQNWSGCVKQGANRTCRWNVWRAEKSRHWMMRCRNFIANNCPREYWPPMPLPIPPNYHKESLFKIEQRAAKIILPPSLRMIIQTHFPLQVHQLPTQQHDSPSRPPKIPPSSQLPPPCVLNLTCWGSTGLRMKSIRSKFRLATKWSRGIKDEARAGVFLAQIITINNQLGRVRIHWNSHVSGAGGC